jgi:hypothetical protein
MPQPRVHPPSARCVTPVKILTPLISVCHTLDIANLFLEPFFTKQDPELAHT